VVRITHTEYQPALRQVFACAQYGDRIKGALAVIANSMRAIYVSQHRSSRRVKPCANCRESHYEFVPDRASRRTQSLTASRSLSAWKDVACSCVISNIRCKRA
jgi:cytidine deaminase